MIKEKLNLTMAVEIKKYLSDEADSLGMSQSAFLTMLVNQYKQQTQALGGLDQLQVLMSQVKNEEDRKLLQDTEWLKLHGGKK